MKITLPELSLIVLIGASGSGKSTFAKKHFKPTEVVSSDFCRGLVCDDENNMDATKSAFEILNFIAGKRLENGKLTVIDATNVQASARASCINLARNYDCLPAAIVLNLPESVCQERNGAREDRQIPSRSVHQHCFQLKRSIRDLKNEGFRYIYILNSLEEVEAVEIERQPMWSNLKDEHGPFDIIGDVHGCFDELKSLVKELGYKVAKKSDIYKITHPESRKLIFLGDIVDRGPKIAECLRFVIDACESGIAFCVPGNHDVKLVKKLNGKDIKISHGLDKTLSELEEIPEFREKARKFFDGLISHYTLDDGKLVVAHAGMKECYQGRSSGRVRDFALYGETTGETDEYGLPERLDWTCEYRGKALVVYGHIAGGEPYKSNNTVCIDTGCVYGGKLTALRYPERLIVSVPAKKVYCESIKPLKTQKEENDNHIADLPDINDILGRKTVSTRLMNNISIQENNAMAALELMSRFSVNPHWLVYLPPTMSPCETSKLSDMLEHPLEAFEYYKSKGIDKIVCEQKHMGSRAVVVVCKDEAAAKSKFKISDGTVGTCYTRTGRRFFDDLNIEKQFIGIIRTALDESGFFRDFKTDFAVLDCELLPWSAKAQSLLNTQYAPTGTAGINGLASAVSALKAAAGRQYDAIEVDKLTSAQNLDLQGLSYRFEERLDTLKLYTESYRKYCWDTDGLTGIKLAPFHILATEGAVYADKEHVWHMETIKKYCTCNNDIMIATPYIEVDTTDETSVQSGVEWWESLTSAGGEGMVVKPYIFTAFKNNELLQPAVKCRGREYLRIIYGAEYTLKENLPRLKARNLSKKRSLALREFSLGIEALERFIKDEPFYKVHECVFGLLAIESEPVDPRL